MHNRTPRTAGGSGRGDSVPAAFYPDILLRSESTPLATDFSVSKIPVPTVAQASNSVAPVEFS